MTVADLVESLDRTASILKEAGWGQFWWNELTERSSDLREAHAKADTKAVRKSVARIKRYFGGMGSLNDIGGVVEGSKVSGLRGALADRYLLEQLDDLFFHCLFWRTDEQEARNRYDLMMKALSEISDSPPRRHYHDQPRWFKKWSD